MRRKAIMLFSMVLAISLCCAVSTVSAKDFCKETSKTMLNSCKSGTKSDQQLAQGNCDNLSDSTAAKNCKDQTKTDKKDADGECNDQYDARQAACQQLGPAAYDPVISPANFPTSTTINNLFMPLVPGTTFIYEGNTGAGLEHNEVEVTDNTKVILGITCREVHDTVRVNGVLTEDTLDWFAQDAAGNVWYFGENSKTIEDDLVVSLEGSWTAGVDGAKPGIIMKAAPAVGDFYRQEFALGTAEDLAQVLSLTEPVSGVFGGPYTNCLKTQETSPLEPDGLEYKFYCTGVGNVLTNDVTAGETLLLINIITTP